MTDELREPTVLEGWDTVRVNENFPHARTMQPDKSDVHAHEQKQTRINSSDIDHRPLGLEAEETLASLGYSVVVKIKTNPNRTNWNVDWSAA